MINITVNKGQMADLKALLAEFPKELPHVLRRAINKTAVTAHKNVLNAIVREVAVKKSDIRNRNVKLDRASFRRLAAIINITGRRIPLLKFGARQTQKGVTYRINKSGGRSKVEHAFMESPPGGGPTTMKSGHKGVFLRWSAGRSLSRRQRAQIKKLGGYSAMGSEGRRSRLPIYELRGPSIPEIAKNAPALQEAALDYDVGGQLEREISSQVEWTLAKRKGVA